MNRIPAIVLSLALASAPAVVRAEDPQTSWQKAQEAFAEAIEKGHQSSVSLKVKAKWNQSAAQPKIQPGAASNPNYTVRPKSCSSGVLIDADGHILTSFFNVDGKVEKIDVTLADGSKTAGTLLGWDESKDLAVIKIDPKDLKLSPIAWAKDAPAVGAFVMALGRSPEPASPTATRGIVSAVDRIEPFNMGINEQTLQFDAKTNYGNSGGPLVNIRGEMVGVVGQVRLNSAWGQNSGVSFATPNWKIQEVLEKMKNGEHLKKPKQPFLGVGPAEGSSGGVTIATVQPGTAAATAGLLAGDIIKQLDGIEVGNWSDFVAVIRKRKPGDTVTLVFTRDGKEMSVEATLGERPGQ